MVRWGIIGGGAVVENKSGAAFARVPDSSLEAIARRSLSAAEDTATRVGAKRAYSDIPRLLADPDVNAVYIATPPGLHLEQALACCAAGKPTFIEKPIARNTAESELIVRSFEAAGVPLSIAHYRRALPRFKELKVLLNDGAIGRPLEVDFRMCRQYPADPRKGSHDWIYDPKLSGGGKFFDIAPHSIDVFVYLFGDMQEISSLVTNTGVTPRVEDLVVFTFETTSGVVGTANFNMASLDKSDSLIVSGTEGALTLSIHGDAPIRVQNNSGTKLIDIANPPVIEEPMIASVVQYFLGAGPNLCSGRDALPTMRVMDEVLDEYYGGRADDFWNRPEKWERPRRAAVE